MNDEKVNEKVETHSEETNVSVDRDAVNNQPQADVKVETTDKTTEKTTEQAPDNSQETAKSELEKSSGSQVNVSVENHIPAPVVRSEPNPNKNYEAAQPVIDAIV